ncbi:MAG TPA: hypothetical protein VFZ61_28140 [Polyangiales bacterium]
MGKARVRWIGAVALWAAMAGAALGVARSQEPSDRQTVLGPGLYIFQTRTRDASCKDSEQDGYVLSYFAAIHGVPHAASMGMELTNTPHFKTWTLKVVGNNGVVGDSRIGTAADAPDSHFEVKLEKDRFRGTGYRTYNGTFEGKKVRCRVNYDALLRRLD